MAIVNSIAFGKTRKSAGNVVFYDRLGQTIARQKNLSPSNPNTYAQVSQRIMITNPSRVYRAIVEATRGDFGNKLFDYSFGKTYLATKRRTAYNEFFFRAMKKSPNVFLSKDEVLSRQTGFVDAYELGQGSLKAVVLGKYTDGSVTGFSVESNPLAEGSSAALQLQAFAAHYSFPARADFKAVVLVLYYKDAGPTRTDLFCRYADITWNEVDGFVFNAKGSGIVIVPTVLSGLSDMVFSTGSFTGFATGGILAGFAIVPFATVDNILTSSNASIFVRSDFPGTAKLLLHTTNAEARELAILSYSPSTPAGSFAASGGASLMNEKMQLKETLTQEEGI